MCDYPSSKSERETARRMCVAIFVQRSASATSDEFELCCCAVSSVIWFKPSVRPYECVLQELDAT